VLTSSDNIVSVTRTDYTVCVHTPPGLLAKGLTFCIQDRAGFNMLSVHMLIATVVSSLLKF